MHKNVFATVQNKKYLCTEGNSVCKSQLRKTMCKGLMINKIK